MQGIFLIPKPTCSPLCAVLNPYFRSHAHNQYFSLKMSDMANGDVCPIIGICRHQMLYKCYSWISRDVIISLGINPKRCTVIEGK